MCNFHYLFILIHSFSFELFPALIKQSVWFSKYYHPPLKISSNSLKKIRNIYVFFCLQTIWIFFSIFYKWQFSLFFFLTILQIYTDLMLNTYIIISSSFRIRLSLFRVLCWWITKHFLNKITNQALRSLTSFYIVNENFTHTLVTRDIKMSSAISANTHSQTLLSFICVIMHSCVCVFFVITCLLMSLYVCLYLCFCVYMFFIS